MVTIENIKRACETERSKIDGSFWHFYIETEEEFLKNIENLCNSIGENNIISIQFLNGEKQEIDRCIITYKE